MTYREYRVLGDRGIVEVFQHRRGFWTAKYTTPAAGTLFATEIRTQTKEEAKAAVEAEGRDWADEWQET